MSSGATQKWGNGLVELSRAGLYCPKGGFHIDPWKGVDRALITHGHADHTRVGSSHYTCADIGLPILELRLGKKAPIEGWPYGERRRLGDVWVSFHPAGHVLGSAQIRIESGENVTVITGDYKRHWDPSCHPFEVVPCDTFITESTFGLPIYQWPDPSAEFEKINTWWRRNSEQGRTSVIYAYSLGKAQRILAGIDPKIGPIGVHRAVDEFLPIYRNAGFPIPETVRIGSENPQIIKGSGLFVLPPSAEAKWMSKLGPSSEAAASGWMRVRGMRRWQSYDQGFVISDHADWPTLHQTIQETGAHHIGVTHGYTTEMVRYLREVGHNAFEVPTWFTGDRED
ncbi:MAG: ligase-associated DNA damage response exonuclease [Opitutales bacterium]|nr:ligase-associated DNA damage response exonuclease [Opitutales bacterium]